MKVKNFAYCKFSVYHTFFFSLLGLFLFFIIHLEDGVWGFETGSIIVSLLAIALFIRFFIRVFIPAITGKSALTLNEEMLCCRVNNKTVYWREVTLISQRRTFINKGTYIAFELLNTDREIHLVLGFIDKDDAVIYRVIQEYFKQSLITEGQPGVHKKQ